MSAAVIVRSDNAAWVYNYGVKSLIFDCVYNKSARSRFAFSVSASNRFWIKIVCFCYYTALTELTYNNRALCLRHAAIMFFTPL